MAGDDECTTITAATSSTVVSAERATAKLQSAMTNPAWSKTSSSPSKQAAVPVDSNKGRRDSGKNETSLSMMMTTTTQLEENAKKVEASQYTKNHKDINMSVAITPEEAAAVRKSLNYEDVTEVNVEELLRIAFQILLEEWHLLNVPVYSTVERKDLVKMVVSAAALLDSNEPQLPKEEEEEEEKVDKDQSSPSWLQIQVMARPSSLGTILDRLERIGVGTEFGTVTVLKAELCCTASPFAHMPVAASNSNRSKDENEKNNNNAFGEGVVKAGSTETNDKLVNDERAIEAARQEWKNAATRWRIEQVREQNC
jgi:hypothetical protein